jgi:hypothetical protein
VCGCLIYKYVILLLLFTALLFSIFFFFFSQFKVHRNGNWQRINFERAANLQLKKADGSDVFLENPWIQHYRTRCAPHVVASADLRKNGASTSQALDLIGNKAACYSKQIHASDSHLCHHNLVGSDTGGAICLDEDSLQLFL